MSKRTDTMEGSLIVYYGLTNASVFAAIVNAPVPEHLKAWLFTGQCFANAVVFGLLVMGAIGVIANRH